MALKKSNQTRTFHRILLIENHAIIQSGIEFILNKSSIRHSFEVAETLGDGLEKLDGRTFDLVIMDIAGHGENYSNIIEIIKNYQQTVKILILSAHEESVFVHPLIQMGVDGFVAKSADQVEITTAIKSVLRCETYVSQKVHQQIFSSWTGESKPANPLQHLSLRETDVLILLMEGCTTSNISNQMNLQPSTISTYKSRIFKKLEVDNIVDLTAKARILRELEY